MTLRVRDAAEEVYLEVSWFWCRATIILWCMSCRNLWRSLVPGAGSFPLMKCVLHFCTWQLPPIPGPLMNVMLGNSLQWESRNVEFVVIRDYQIDPDDKVYLIFDSLQTPTRCLCLRNCNHVLCSPQLQPDVFVFSARSTVCTSKRSYGKVVDLTLYWTLFMKNDTKATQASYQEALAHQKELTKST